MHTLRARLVHSLPELNRSPVKSFPLPPGTCKHVPSSHFSALQRKSTRTQTTRWCFSTNMWLSLQVFLLRTSTTSSSNKPEFTHSNVFSVPKRHTLFTRSARNVKNRPVLLERVNHKCVQRLGLSLVPVVCTQSQKTFGSIDRADTFHIHIIFTFTLSISCENRETKLLSISNWTGRDLQKQIE